MRWVRFFLFVTGCFLVKQQQMHVQLLYGTVCVVSLPFCPRLFHFESQRTTVKWKVTLAVSTILKTVGHCLTAGETCWQLLPKHTGELLSTAFGLFYETVVRSGTLTYTQTVSKQGKAGELWSHTSTGFDK